MTVHFVVPAGIDDPARPSGGNTYDRRVRDGLTAAGWAVHVHEVPDAPAALADALAQIPDGAVVLLDGLVASPVPEVLVPESRRLRLVTLVHMPLGQAEPDEREAAVLSAVAAVVTTSAWARQALLDLYELPAERVHVAEPGVEAAQLAPGTATGDSLLAVAAVIPGKGHDVLLDALATLNGRRWRCLCVGTLDRDPDYAAALQRRAVDRGMGGRMRFSGAQPDGDLARSYGAADLLVLPSRSETYGMVVTEALARGLPVVAADVGGVPEALGHGADGTRPGMLVPPDDAAALGEALRAWLEDPGLRRRLRRAARERRESLRDWSATTSTLADVLASAA
ncbi:MAG TPA: glycosyltransferase family 4 protein [Gaiellaceae bacterium]